MAEPLVQKLNALVIEDSADCAALLNHILLDAKIFGEINLFKSGEEGVKYLEEKVKGQGKDFLPDLVFLDLNLPGEHGLETLDKIKKYSEFHSIPVVVMTASEDRRDLIESYKKGGAFFIHKPLDKDLLIEILMHMKMTGVLKKHHE